MVTAADVLEYDLGEIYKARPDLMAVIHTHAQEVIPFTVTSVPLRPMIHMAGFIPQSVPVFEIRDVAGSTADLLITSNDLGRALAQRAPGWAYHMTVNAKTELQATSISGGKVTYLAPEEAGKATMQDGFERAWTY